LTCGKLIAYDAAPDAKTRRVHGDRRRNPNDGKRMAELYIDSDEQATCLGAIEELAQKTNLPFAEVKEVYEVEFARLKTDARVTDFLVLFASRRARERLSLLHG
jgi:hypothetical protein